MLQIRALTHLCSSLAGVSHPDHIILVLILVIISPIGVSRALVGSLIISILLLLLLAVLVPTRTPMLVRTGSQRYSEVLSSANFG